MGYSNYIGPPNTTGQCGDKTDTSNTYTDKKCTQCNTCDTNSRWCTDHSSGCGHKFYTCEDTYSNHVNYSDHWNYSIPYPTGNSITSVTQAKIENWQELSDAVDDIQKIKHEIDTLYKTKVQQGGTGIKENPTNNLNVTDNFGPGKLARADQINETINNVNLLWERIKGESNVLSKESVGQPIKKQKYKEILAKINTISETEQTPNGPWGYINHINYGCGHNSRPSNYSNNYTNYSDTGGGYINKVNENKNP